jgi:hypothetical protein
MEMIFQTLFSYIKRLFAYLFHGQNVTSHDWYHQLTTYFCEPKVQARWVFNGTNLEIQWQSPKAAVKEQVFIDSSDTCIPTTLLIVQGFPQIAT